MSLDALSSNDLFNFIIYDTISAMSNTSNHDHRNSSETNTLFFADDKCLKNHHHHQDHEQQQELEEHPKPNSGVLRKRRPSEAESDRAAASLPPTTTKKKRKRKAKSCKNKEEAETQRMTHIAVERNRRKQMNEHLSVLRSLMPESYVQRGDQASIVGGAVEFVKELEHLLSTLEAKKLQILDQEEVAVVEDDDDDHEQEDHHHQNMNELLLDSRSRKKLQFSSSSVLNSAPFATLLMNSSSSSSDHNNFTNNCSKYTSKTKASSAEIEVTLIETHANLRILSKRTHRQLLKLIAGLQSLRLTILHLNLTDFHPFVLYSISLKVEEGCQLRSVDDIAAAAHHMVRIIEEEAILC